MIASPRLDHDPDRMGYLDPASVLVIPGNDDGLMIECEVTDPPSQRGRLVYVYIQPEQIVAVMKAARRVATRTRMRPRT